MVEISAGFYRENKGLIVKQLELQFALNNSQPENVTKEKWEKR